jgi:CheY-like chemotaxis protein
MSQLVLVIDDSLTVCKIIEQCLHRGGYEVICFRSGEALIGWLKSRDARVPNLVFVDLCLPKMDGYSVIQYLRAEPVFKDIPIVILSRLDGLINKLKGRLTGASNYIVKPFKTEDLISVAQMYLGAPLPVTSS